MASDVFSLDELAQKVGIQSRTIRSYIQQGLLRGPESMGRNAHYTDYHLKRLEVIKTLKDDYALSLSEIRRLVTIADPDEDIEIVSLLPRMMQEKSSATLFSAKEVEEPQASALDFVRARQSLSREQTEYDEADIRQDIRPKKSQRSRSRPMSRPARERVSPRLEHLLEQLKAISSGNPKRRTRGQDWIRLRITPDIEFHIRGQLSREQLACFEQLADTMRHILMGENGDE